MIPCRDSTSITFAFGVTADSTVVDNDADFILAKESENYSEIN